MRLLISAFCLLLATPGPVSVNDATFRWTREISIAPGDSATACGVLTADVYHNSLPALRDVRLFENGKEAQFVVDESYDEKSLASGVTGTQDRSYFENVDVDTPTDKDGVQTAHFQLPARVPMERIELKYPVGASPVEMNIIARTVTEPGAAEVVNGSIRPGVAVFPVTIGANLQNDVEVAVTLRGMNAAPAEIAIQMRRRWICFPHTEGARYVMMYGGPDKPHAPYAIEHNFVMPAKPSIATMGPQIENSAYSDQPQDDRQPSRLWLLALTLSVFLMAAMWWFRRRPPLQPMTH